MSDDTYCFGVHDPNNPIIGTKTQAISCDNRDCDNRKGVANGDMENAPILRPEAANIFKRLDGLGLTQQALAEQLNLEPNKISKARHGERQFKGHEVLRAHEWFDEQERLKRPLDIKHAPDRLPTVNASAGDGVVEIIALDLSISMGPGTLIEEFIEEQPIKIDIATLRGLTRSPFESLRIIKGIGDSMEPTIRSADQVLVDTAENTLGRLHGIYWMDYLGAHGLKRLRPVSNGRIKIISDNEEAGETFEVDAGEVRIHGRALRIWRDL